MIRLKLGTNMSPELIGILDGLNETHADKNARVSEVYGSMRLDQRWAARPGFRLPDVMSSDFAKHVQQLKNIGIDFNYTMNTINPGSKRSLVFEGGESMLSRLLEFLESADVHRVTVASPLLAKLIRKHSQIPLELSTIAHVDAVSQIKYYAEELGISKICCNLMKNRSFKWLAAASKVCDDLGVEFELMTNEFCGVAGEGYGTHCVYRDSCYLCHASDETIEDAKLLGNYPMEECMSSRATDAASWLRMRWIRPEDLKAYEDIGITSFKITGRTGTVDYIRSVAEAYLSRNFDGNLLELWKPLETITNGGSEKDHEHKVQIPNKQLDGFLNKWSKDHDFECANVLCHDCRYCDNWSDSKKLGMTK